jgi:hypothetical protein
LERVWAFDFALNGNEEHVWTADLPCGRRSLNRKILPTLRTRYAPTTTRFVNFKALTAIGTQECDVHCDTPTAPSAQPAHGNRLRRAAGQSQPERWVSRWLAVFAACRSKPPQQN